MERKLKAWIDGYSSTYAKMPPSREIKQSALRFSTNRANFKASKGWLEKFLLRHNLTGRKQKERLAYADATFLRSVKLEPVADQADSASGGKDEADEIYFGAPKTARRSGEHDDFELN